MHLVGCLYYLYQWCTVKQISDNEIYLLIKYIKSVLWRVAKCVSYIEEARCLKVNMLIFKTSSTCFEPEGSSSGRRLYVQLWYIICSYANDISSLVGGRLFIPLACKQIIPYQYVQQSSWRRTLGFETRRRGRKMKILV